MLVPNGQTPQIRLPDRRGLKTALSDFLGRRRIVLVFGAGCAYFAALSAQRDGIDERDIVVLIILPPDHPLLSAPASPPIFVLTDDDGVASAYGAPPDGRFFCLIGKDGTLKQAGRDLPTPAALFDMVDAMPMRRQEMQDKERTERG